MDSLAKDLEKLESPVKKRSKLEEDKDKYKDIRLVCYSIDQVFWSYNLLSSTFS